MVYIPVMPQVFDYHDYRAFLKDAIEEMRATSSLWTYRYVGAKVGMDASQVLKIVQGQLHLAEKKIADFARFCKLEGTAAEYFRLLVLFNKARAPEQAKLYFEQMLNLAGVPTLEITRDQYAFFSQWFYTAVWCALAVFRCEHNYAALGAFLRPTVGASEVKEALQLLERLKLAERDATGVWKSTQRNLSTGRSWRSLAVTQYQQEMARLGGEALERFPKTERDFSTLTLNVGQGALEELRSVTEEYRRTVARLSNQCDEIDRVYQLNIQLFPLTASVTDVVSMAEVK